MPVDVAAEKAKIESQFQSDMQDALNKRNKALAKFPSDNLAEEAWNQTKAKEDPVYAECAMNHREKLDTHADSAIKSGLAESEFEKKVLELHKARTKSASA